MDTRRGCQSPARLPLPSRVPAAPFRKLPPAGRQLTGLMSLASSPNTEFLHVLGAQSCTFSGCSYVDRDSGPTLCWEPPGHPESWMGSSTFRSVTLGQGLPCTATGRPWMCLRDSGCRAHGRSLVSLRGRASTMESPRSAGSSLLLSASWRGWGTRAHWVYRVPFSRAVFSS